MTKNKKYFLIFACVIFCVLPLTAQKKYYKPLNSEFVAVFSFEITPAPENEFLLSYFGKSSSSMYIPKEYRPEIDKTKYDVMILKHEVFAQLMQASAHSGLLAEDEALKTVRIPMYQRTAEFLGLKITLYGLKHFHFYLPFHFKVKVPKGVRYVYLGHFEFKRAGGMDYTITDVKVSDRFDEAVQTVKERYGENAELVRLPLEAADSSK